jgi:hypothetical protein
MTGKQERELAKHGDKTGDDIREQEKRTGGQEERGSDKIAMIGLQCAIEEHVGNHALNFVFNPTS